MDDTTYTDAQAYLDGLRSLLSRIDASSINALTDLLLRTWRDDRVVLVFGNGGSASTAGHWVTDLVKTAGVEGMRSLRAISLADNMGLTTAIANDLDYCDSFRFALEAYARPGDVAVAISASGNSPNIVVACEWAKLHSIHVVALTGFSGGSIAELADLHIHVPSDNYGLVEDTHLSIGHMVTQSLKARVMEKAVLQ
ncbi:MAG: SIS domain-containing protein [Phycisphaerae bacterium]